LLLIASLVIGQQSDLHSTPPASLSRMGDLPECTLSS
jgi:hypothetical protein